MRWILRTETDLATKETREEIVFINGDQQVVLPKEAVTQLLQLLRSMSNPEPVQQKEAAPVQTGIVSEKTESASPGFSWLVSPEQDEDFEEE